MAEFAYTELLPKGPDTTTEYRLLTTDYVSTITLGDRQFLQVDPEAMRLLTSEAMRDIAHLLRPGHLAQLAAILDDPEASANDRFVATELLRNANIAAGGVLPGCQDTGTAVVVGHKGERVLTDADDERSIAQGRVRHVSDLQPALLPDGPAVDVRRAQHRQQPAGPDRDLCHTGRHLLVPVHGQGRRLGQQVVFVAGDQGAVLNPDSLTRFLDEQLRTLGTAACPPYHLAVVIGGTSAEYTLKVAKYASARYLDTLPTEGSATGHAYRDLEWEDRILELTRQFGIGAQFGGKYFCHDVRVIRLPRHGASCPVGVAVSCSADRQALGKITAEGVFLEQLETDPARFLPEVTDDDLGGQVVRIDLDQPMADILAELTRYPVKTRLALTGTLVVARDLAHAKIKERLDAGEPMPEYLRDHPVYYAGPAKTPEGYASGSFGPTTAGRMDAYVDQFQAAGGSLVMLAKGNRSRPVVDACARHGGFYLGSIGGPAARLAKDSIRKVEVLEYPELGMEAVFRIEVEDFPAFIVTDDKGNDFFTEVSTPVSIN